MQAKTDVFKVLFHRYILPQVFFGTIFFGSKLPMQHSLRVIFSDKNCFFLFYPESEIVPLWGLKVLQLQ